MKEVFPIVPATGVALWFVAGITVLMALLTGMFLWIGWATQRTEFEVSTESLAIHGDMYSRTILRSDMVLHSAQIVDLRTDREHRLKIRTNGCGLPGYASGWFRLANGEKALAFVTSSNEVVYIPTTKGYSLLISPQHPYRLLEALRSGH